MYSLIPIETFVVDVEWNITKKQFSETCNDSFLHNYENLDLRNKKKAYLKDNVTENNELRV